MHLKSSDFLPCVRPFRAEQSSHIAISAISISGSYDDKYKRLSDISSPVFKRGKAKEQKLSKEEWVTVIENRNPELAEELAFALLSKIYDINSLMGIWTTESSELISYAALMAASRNARTLSEVAFVAAEKAVKANPSSRNIAHGVVALLCYIAQHDKSVVVGLPTLLASMPDGAVKLLPNQCCRHRPV